MLIPVFTMTPQTVAEHKHRYLCNCMINCTRKLIWVTKHLSSSKKVVRFITDQLSHHAAEQRILLPPLMGWHRTCKLQETQRVGTIYLAAVVAYVSWKRMLNCSLASELWLEFNCEAVWEAIILRLGWTSVYN